MRRRWIISLLSLLFACCTFAQPEPTTRPIIPLPSQFSDEQRQTISIELFGHQNDAAALAGTISVGGVGLPRQFPLTARLDGSMATGTFTDDSGDKFGCTLQMDG